MSKKLSDFVKADNSFPEHRMCRVCRIGTSNSDLLVDINTHLKNKTSYPAQILRFLREEYKITDITFESFRNHVRNSHHITGRNTQRSPHEKK